MLNIQSEKNISILLKNSSKSFQVLDYTKMLKLFLEIDEPLR